MQLIRQHIERDTSGTITLRPIDPEDMWYAYNLIQPTDLLSASAIRRVTTTSATGSTSSTRMHIPLLIRVRSTDFDPQAATLHVSGQIAAETQYAKVGQYHTLDLELQRNFTLEKAEGWDSVAREVVREACAQGSARVGAWAVVMQEGKAAIVGLGAERTVVKGRVEVSVPGKRAGTSGHDKALEKFFGTLLETLLRHVDLAEGLPILLASPGFTAAAFQKFVQETAVRRGDKALMGQKGNFLVVHSSSGHVHALNEVLQSPEVQARLKDTKYTRETKLMDDFMTLLRKDDGRAWYGPKEVEMAVEKGAVGRGGGVLLISNGLFRAQDVAIRRRWVTLVDKVKDDEGGEVRVLSSEHESGKRLEGLGGIAAILTFPLEDLDEGEGEGEDDDDDNEDQETILNGTTNENPNTIEF
ncbi:Translation factor pelota [Ptychographa xylographoides]|nr:Translation factor pelota [Ptychographa xylographoides]